MEFLVRLAAVPDLDMLVRSSMPIASSIVNQGEPDRIRQFLLDRFEHNQSVIFVALIESLVVGFTQL